jgi:hypothetical protein
MVLSSLQSVLDTHFKIVGDLNRLVLHILIWEKGEFFKKSTKNKYNTVKALPKSSLEIVET